MNNIKIGDTIKIIKMEGEPQYTSREGKVTHIDEAVHSSVGIMGVDFIFHFI